MMNGCASYHWLERLIPFPESMKRRPCDEGRWKILKEENTKFNLFELVMDFCGDDIHPCPVFLSPITREAIKEMRKGKSQQESDGEWEKVSCSDNTLLPESR